MAYAISLYDALVSINVPKPQALAVVESLEQTMTSELTTKTDLQQLRDHTDREFVSVRADIQQFREHSDREFVAVRADIKQLRADMDREFVAVRAEIQQLRADMDREFVAVRAEIQQLRADMDREFAAVRAEMARGFEEQTQGRAADVALLRSEMSVAISRASMRSTLFMMAWTSLLFAAMQFLGS
jgi:vacuolar-type H+-ATPase subunit D/Vma8